MSSSSNTNTPTDDAPQKKSLYQRFWEFKNHRNKQISEEDMLKYTGKSRAELIDWSKTAPGVGGNQPAGTLAVGPAHGIGGVAAGAGLGGWGFGAKGELKFPNKGPTEQKKKEVEDDSE
ncbi:hypothetical protein QBC43DRAFT_201641 [Cladorrhinum sp. PSN259]|nr:hypothetical protein QBC43DRAFT_201641 [Cladorrhinum sp. PSN259]